MAFLPGFPVGSGPTLKKVPSVVRRVFYVKTSTFGARRAFGAAKQVVLSLGSRRFCLLKNASCFCVCFLAASQTTRFAREVSLKIGSSISLGFCREKLASECGLFQRRGAYFPNGSGFSNVFLDFSPCTRIYAFSFGGCCKNRFVTVLQRFCSVRECADFPRWGARFCRFRDFLDDF